jgi:hypothetical protein
VDKRICGETWYISVSILTSITVILLKNRSQFPSKRFRQIKFGGDGSVIKGNVLENRVTFRLYLSFHWSDFTEILHLAISTNALPT